MKKTMLGKLFVILFVFMVVVSGTVILAQEAQVEKLPPEPAEPPVIKVKVNEISVPKGKEIVLDVYTIVKGDWLSKIAKREYGDHTLWRVIYRYNKYVKDSHWIFPGDKIVLPKIINKLPKIPKITKKKKEPEKKVEKLREYGDFLAPPDFDFSGTITDFKTEKALHSQADYLFIDLGKEDGITQNQRLYIYRKGRVVSHPYTGELMGIIVEKIGEIIVTKDIEDYVSTAKIIYSDRSVEVGDMLLIAR